VVSLTVDEIATEVDRDPAALAVVILAEVRDELRGIRKALETALAPAPPELEPDAIACPHCGNADPEKLEATPDFGEDGGGARWTCLNVECCKSFRRANG